MHAEIRELVGQVLIAQDSDEPLGERHYFLCAKCGQAIDARSVAQVVHHLKPEHSRLSEATLTELNPFDFSRHESVIVMTARCGLSGADVQPENRQ
jgi:hypothetical protein